MCTICTIITFPRIAFPVELRGWDSNKPTLIQFRFSEALPVSFRSASSKLLKKNYLDNFLVKTYTMLAQTDMKLIIHQWQGGLHHGKLGCVYAMTITAMSILLLREENFQVLVILK